MTPANLERQNAILRVLLSEVLKWDFPNSQNATGLQFDKDRISRMADFVQENGHDELPLKIALSEKNISVVLTRE